MGETPSEHYPQNGRRRDYAARYLRGDGIEIGGLHNPLDLSGLPVARVRQVDRHDLTELRKQYPALANHDLVAVDIIDDGQRLATIADASLDFVVANHFIEHCDDPLGTLERWLAKLRPGGVVYMAVPDKRVGFEQGRPLTSLAHIVADYRRDAVERERANVEHFAEWVDYFTQAFPADSLLTREERISHLIATDYSIHFHVFTYESFADLLAHARDAIGLPIEVVAAVRPSRTAWESLFVLRKWDRATEGSGSTSGAEEHAPEDRAALEARWQEDQIELARGDMVIEYLRARLAEAEGRAPVAPDRQAAQAIIAERDRALATKDGHITALKARLSAIEGGVLPWKNDYIAYLEGYIRNREKSTALRAGDALRRLVSRFKQRA